MLILITLLMGSLFFLFSILSSIIVIVLQYLCLFWGSDNSMYSNLCVYQEDKSDPDPLNHRVAPRPPCRSFCTQVIPHVNYITMTDNRILIEVGNEGLLFSIDFLLVKIVMSDSFFPLAWRIHFCGKVPYTIYFFDSDFPFFFHDRCRKCRTHHFYFYRRLLDYDVIAYFAGCKCLC